MNVQTMKPKTAKTAQDTTLSPRAITAYANGMAAPGTYRAGTTRGWVREKKSIKSLSNILGDSGDTRRIGLTPNLITTGELRQLLPVASALRRLPIGQKVKRISCNKGRQFCRGRPDFSVLL